MEGRKQGDEDEGAAKPPANTCGVMPSFFEPTSYHRRAGLLLPLSVGLAGNRPVRREFLISYQMLWLVLYRMVEARD